MAIACTYSTIQIDQISSTNLAHADLKSERLLARITGAPEGHREIVVLAIA